MRYFFILGLHPALSFAEISAVLADNRFEIKDLLEAAIVIETEKELDLPALMRRLGGTIKAGRIIDGPAKLTDDEVLAKAADHLLTAHGDDSRPVFGFSAYTALGVEGVRSLAKKIIVRGMETKKILREQDRASRWVRPQTGLTLSSVVVTKNKLIEEGAEFVVLIDRNSLVSLAVTEAVQPFEEFSRADYGRPARDTHQGMLPPKLARMMINLAGVGTDAVIIDPFCGSGTVLTEAIQMGFQDVVGSDLNPTAVKSTEQNITWLKEHGSAPKTVRLFASDARHIGQHLEPASIDAVVAETFLGSPRHGREKRSELQKTLSDLSRLYYESLGAWRRLLKPGAAVVLALPVYVLGPERHGLKADEFVKLGYAIEPLLKSDALVKLDVKETKNRGLVYGRADQLVWREIIRLRWNGDPAAK
ncbi:MAG: DNA methyltransferase [Patescibacteria group bacterium]|jgi:tRNA (guanine10-N2)-dimethyltransferase